MTNEEYINELKKLREKKFSLDEKIEKLNKTFEKYKNDEILVKLTLKELKVIDSAFADWECNSSNYLIDYNQYQIWIKLNNILLKMLEKRGDDNKKNRNKYYKKYYKKHKKEIYAKVKKWREKQKYNKISLKKGVFDKCIN